MSLLDSLDPAGGGDGERSLNWRPETPGDAVEGTVERMGSVDTDYGTMKVAEVRSADGVLHGVFGKGSLGKDFDFFQLSPGDALAVRFDGKRISASNREYNSFRAVARKPDGRLIKTSDRLDHENPEAAARIREARAKREAEQAAQGTAPKAAPVSAAHLDQPAPATHTPGYGQAGPPPAGPAGGAAGGAGGAAGYDPPPF